MDLYNQTHHRDETKTPSFASGVLYQVVRRRVSHHALKMIRKQETLARDSLAPERTPTECGGFWSQQMGLPCSHLLRQKILENGMIELREIERHWYVFQDGVDDTDEDTLRHIQDPRIRPTRRPNVRRNDASTTRDRSHDELPRGLHGEANVHSSRPPGGPRARPRVPAGPRHCRTCRNTGHDTRNCPSRSVPNRRQDA